VESPSWPFEPRGLDETDMWARLWRKPQAFMWDRLGLGDQVAAYVRAYTESTEPGASAGLKTAVLRMETELGISVAGMRQNGWRISGASAPVEAPPAARQTSSGDWLKAVSVEGA
jgi:hypothetical protein